MWSLLNAIAEQGGEWLEVENLEALHTLSLKVYADIRAFLTLNHL